MDAITYPLNHLLAALPAADLDLIRPHLKTAELAQDEVLVKAGETLTQVFFPFSGAISLLATLANGDAIEVAMIGRDSNFGGMAALGDRIAATDAVVQISGRAATLDVETLRTAAESSAALRMMLIRHEQALFAQARQSAACNAYHGAEARMARVLLRMHDLSDSAILPITQECLGQLIGVRRNSISLVAHGLRKAGILKYSRGYIEITDLAGLRQLSCECCEAVKIQRQRLLNEDSARVPAPLPPAGPPPGL